ncbi:MAG: hypothetical protein JXN61_06675 [Sedimentisphaerales bacterium]|nr:hypothetical protein [Sedimentisphaerales bacterium]
MCHEREQTRHGRRSLVWDLCISNVLRIADVVLRISRHRRGPAVGGSEFQTGQVKLSMAEIKLHLTECKLRMARTKLTMTDSKLRIG